MCNSKRLGVDEPKHVAYMYNNVRTCMIMSVGLDKNAHYCITLQFTILYTHELSLFGALVLSSQNFNKKISPSVLTRAQFACIIAISVSY